MMGLTACHPDLSSGSLAGSVVVASVERKVREHLEEMGLGSPYIESMTVGEILEAICKHQGIFLEGEVQASLKQAISRLHGHLQAVTSTSADSGRSLSHTGTEREMLMAKEIADLRSELARLRQQSLGADQDQVSQQFTSTS